MKLRARLAFITIGVALLLTVVALLGYRELSQRASDDMIAALVRSDAMDQRCDGHGPTQRNLTVPQVRGGPRSTIEQSIELRTELFADAQVVRERAPELLERVEAGAPLAVRAGPGELREFVIALPEPGASCSHAFVRAPSLRRSPWPPPLVIGPLAVALLSVVIGLGPVVRRARMLTLAVSRWQQRPEHAELPLPDPTPDEIGELSRAYHAAAQTIRAQHDTLVARERELREFVENVSHDLATPLTVLRGHLSAIASHDDAQRERIGSAMVEAQYLGALLCSLALTAKLDANVQVDAVFDLGAVVQRVADRHRVIARELEVSLEHFEGDEPVLVSGDPTFAEQALDNLVGNAIRYNHAGGHVALLLERERERFVVQVIDDGPGMSADELERARKRGERGDRARSRERPGLGLGLSIVARVAELHGWTFTLRAGAAVGIVAELRGPVHC